MNIILPPGSTSIELQTAIDNSSSEDTIIISSDMPFSDTVTLVEDKEITIQSDAGNHWVMLVPDTNIRHFTIRGNLVLQNTILDGENIGGGIAIISGSLIMNAGAIIQNCRSGFSGGGINANTGIITMNEGAVIQKCYSAGNGGGIYANPNGTITVNGGIIQENTSAAAGGGIMFQESTFIMTAGEFLHNKANASGGGIQMLGNNSVTISDSIIRGNISGFQGGGIGIPINTNARISNVLISENTASYNGGGAYIQGTATISDVTFSGNIASVLGGAIYSYTSGQTELIGESYIINNIAANGGGIYTVANNYSNLNTNNKTVFQCNRALTAYQPPEDASMLYPNIQFASTSITEHPLNNFDINYNTSEPIEIFLNVTYDANGGSGSYIGPDTAPGGTDIILSVEDTGIQHPTFAFTKWNTMPDGSGISYTPNDLITLNCDVILYAQWTESSYYNVSYNSNGGTGDYVDPNRQYGINYMILSASQTGIQYSGYTFIEWNSMPDGSGISYSPGDIITIIDDLNIFAQWMRNSEPKPKKICRNPMTKCRISIEGQKIWIDDDNIQNTRPPSIEIILLRDGEEYKRIDLDSSGDGYFGFCCLPKWKNPIHKYDYQIDEATVPDGYTKTIEGYHITNTLIT